MSTPLDDRLAALRAATELARGRLDDDAVAAAEAVVARAGARIGLGIGTTIVVLAGPTGAGKSTLFNALAGSELARAGHLRPTTSTPTAATWGDVGDDLLDWLGVQRRHRLGGEPGGLVLVDLPDVDSIATAHRREADRMIDLADLVAWVVDPQKYADSSIHDEYLRPLSARREATVVILNQADRLEPGEFEECLQDLRRLLDADGLAGVPLIGTAGAVADDPGVGRLQSMLEQRVAAREDALARISADADVAAERLHRLHGGATAPGRVRDGERARLVDALADAAGVPVVVRAVEAAHRRRGALVTGWPVVRWLRRLRPDPLRRLGLGTRDAGADIGPGAVPSARRSSLAPATALQLAQAATATRALVEHASSGLADPWPRHLAAAARASEASLPDRLDRAVTGAELPARRPRWWWVAGALQVLLLATAALGAIWLALLAIVGFLHLQQAIVTPTWRGLPVPTLLLVGGALAGLLLSMLAGLVHQLAAARRGRSAQRILHERVGEVADQHVVGPLEAELAVHRQLDSLLVAARHRG